MSAIDFPPAKPALSDGGALTLSALAAIFWGTNFEATRVALEHLSPWTAAAGRFAIAAVAILVWLWLSRGLNLRVLRRNWPAFVGLGIAGVAGFNAALFLGMKTSSPVTAALIMGTTPLTTNLLDALLHWQRPKAVALLGMAISLLGVALTVGAFSGTRFAPGDLLILIGSLGWALYTIGCRSWVREAAAIETAAWTMVFGAIGLVAIAFALESPVHDLLHSGPAAQLIVVYMALVGSVLSYIFWQLGIAVRGPGATSVLFNLVPVAALFVAAACGRMPGLSQVAGVVVAILGVLLASGRLPLPSKG
ncbi:DMT family transporter [Acidimangrovimonas pyrenivorans]|uniref:DMT family transporter n=1 Tax=Acidimangrovimonas pyrenivorans TaxID=2030798 RepID=A0ABV7ADL6_9RHOB